MNPAAIQAVSFDLDGTLYDHRKFRLRQWLRLAPVLDILGQVQTIRDELRSLGHLQGFRTEEASRLAVRRGLKPDQAARLIQRVVFERWMDSFRYVKPFAGVRRVLEFLAAQGLKLAVISDHPVQERLEPLGLSDLPWQAMISAYDVDALKPDPRPFLAAAERLKLTPRCILHVGDREDCDIAGGRAAGMRTALFLRGRAKPESRADLVFSRWADFVPAARQAGLFAI